MDHRLRKTGYLFLCLILLLALGIIAVNAQEDQPQGGYKVFIPGVFNRLAPENSISGRVVSLQDVPIGGVTILTDRGQSVVTDQDGEYSLDRLIDGVYTLTPSLGDTAFSPGSSSIVVPPDVTRLNFTAQVSCSEAIVNGGFESETGWDIPLTDYPAGYSIVKAHSGTHSMRTGITNPSDNTYSYSSARQKVTLPAGVASAYLTFWVNPSSGNVGIQSLPAEPTIGEPLTEAAMASDVQYVLILDSHFNIIDTLVWQLSDSETWTRYQFNLMEYAGETIYVHFGTYNDGVDGSSSMYVDDVSLQICPGTTPPTPTPTPGPCVNWLDNSGFEAVSDWQIPLTAYPAGYSTAQAHSGSWSMRTGIIKPADNVFSYSDFRQAVSIPSGTLAATARFWLYTLSGELGTLAQPESIIPTGRPFSETTLSRDLQYVLVLDEHQNWIDTLVWQRSDQGYWHYYEFDLRRYAGHTIYLQFGTYNDGLDGISSTFVDDVSLDNCLTTPTPSPSPTPTATPTPTPGACQELIVNNNFSGTNGWVILNTGYPAGYSYSEYHSAFRSMRTGIVNPIYNTYSYSDFRQVVTIPTSAHHVTLKMWLYPISGELAVASLPEPVRTRYFGTDKLDSDIQYLLVLDQDQVWIGTLVWMRNNSQAWTSQQFDLSAYAGSKIMLQWGTYNQGTGGVTAMYVDDVTLQACP